jgi:predicted Zn-ribbon and HTH transcriptional regulator
MPIASYKKYICPKCGYEKYIYGGDVIMTFPRCPKCQSVMELKGV